MARAATDTMRSWEASLAAVLALCLTFRMMSIIHDSIKACAEAPSCASEGWPALQRRLREGSICYAQRDVCFQAHVARPGGAGAVPAAGYPARHHRSLPACAAGADPRLWRAHGAGPAHTQCAAAGLRCVAT